MNDIMEENRILQIKCRELEKANKGLVAQVGHLTEDIGVIKTSLANQTVILRKISRKLFPEIPTLQLFPIKTLDEVKAMDQIEASVLEEDMTLYIQTVLGLGSISNKLQLIFSDDVLMCINWDGKQKKFAINTLNFFSNTLYNAIKTTDLNYITFEKDMRAGFRRCKNRIYARASKTKAKDYCTLSLE